MPWPKKRHILFLSTVRTSRQKLCNQRVSCLLGVTKSSSITKIIIVTTQKHLIYLIYYEKALLVLLGVITREKEGTIGCLIHFIITFLGWLTNFGDFSKFLLVG